MSPMKIIIATIISAVSLAVVGTAAIVAAIVVIGTSEGAQERRAAMKARQAAVAKRRAFATEHIPEARVSGPGFTHVVWTGPEGCGDALKAYCEHGWEMHRLGFTRGYCVTGRTRLLGADADSITFAERGGILREGGYCQ